MKNLFNRTLSILCAVMLLISAVSAWAAAEEAATPTDLIPQEGEFIPEEPGKEPEPEGDGITSVEVVITKTLTVGQSWEGKMKKTKPAVLKLDVARPGLVYMLVEGKDVWATVEKSDRQNENPSRTQTDPETDRMVISWEAEEGSYLITLGPVEPNLLAIATVNFMDKTAYDVWEAEQAEKEPEVEKNDEKLEAELDTEIKSTEEKNQSEESEEQSEQGEDELPNTNDSLRSITVEVTTDVPEPVIGDVAHFRAVLNGYDGLNYTMQWQYSHDKQTWIDIPGETDEKMDVVVTPENNIVYWRILVYLEEEQGD